MFFAQTDTAQPLLDLAQYGILGLIVVGFIIGWIWPKPAVDRLIKSYDDGIKVLKEEISGLKEQLTALHSLIEGEKRDKRD